MIPNLDESWQPIKSLLYQEPLLTLNREILPNISYQPNKDKIFEVFKMPVENIKVVILGQDPYPSPNVAVGRAFAIAEGTRIPVNLRNIITEIGKSSVEISKTESWETLQHWQDQGVFLLNTALTVETSKAGSHLKYWQDFTKRVISYISVKQPCIWILWGRKAEGFIPYINVNPYYVKNYSKETIKNIPANSNWNYILTAPHPAAEAYTGGKAGFFGCNHFVYTNQILKNLKKQTINW